MAIAHELYATDIGPACDCGGTIWSYVVTYDADRDSVECRCAGCHATGFFYRNPKDARHVATIREAHAIAMHYQRQRDARRLSFV